MGVLVSLTRSLNCMRVKLCEKFKGYVPTATGDFSVGYFDGPASKQIKVALVTDHDHESMYNRHLKGGLISLWCDGKLNDSKKRGRDEGDRSRREEREEVDTNYKELLERHGNNYETQNCVYGHE